MDEPSPALQRARKLATASPEERDAILGQSKAENRAFNAVLQALLAEQPSLTFVGVRAALLERLPEALRSDVRVGERDFEILNGLYGGPFDDAFREAVRCVFGEELAEALEEDEDFVVQVDERESVRELQQTALTLAPEGVKSDPDGLRWWTETLDTQIEDQFEVVVSTKRRNRSKRERRRRR